MKKKPVATGSAAQAPQGASKKVAVKKADQKGDIDKTEDQKAATRRPDQKNDSE